LGDHIATNKAGHGEFCARTGRGHRRRSRGTRSNDSLATLACALTLARNVRCHIAFFRRGEAKQPVQRRQDGHTSMADQKGLQRIGVVFGAVTIAITLIAGVVTTLASVDAARYQIVTEASARSVQ
jgi:hypothetical protein